MSYSYTSSWGVPVHVQSRKKAQESLFLSASWASSCRYCGSKAWCIFHGEFLLPCLQRICKISSAGSRVLCLQMRNPPLPFSHLLSVISGVNKAKETPENKKHWKCCFRPRTYFAVPGCQVQSQDTICTCGQPSSLPQQLPRHSWPCCRGQAHHAGLCRGAQEAAGAGWVVSTYMFLHWRSWWTFLGFGQGRGRGPQLAGGEGGAGNWRQSRQLPSKDRSSDASVWSLLKDVLSVVSGTDCDFNSSFDQGWSVTSRTALAFGSAANSANVCIEQIRHKDTGTEQTMP